MQHSTVDLAEQVSHLSTRLWLASRDGDRPAAEAAALKAAARAVSQAGDDIFSGMMYLGEHAPEHAGEDQNHRADS